MLWEPNSTVAQPGLPVLTSAVYIHNRSYVYTLLVPRGSTTPATITHTVSALSPASATSAHRY